MWEFPLDDGLLLARPDVSGVFLLNSTAEFLWYELQRGLTPAEAVSSFTSRFGISAELAHRDITATMADWSEGLLAPSPPVPLPKPPVDLSCLRPLDCLVHGEPLRVLLDPGDVWEELAPRLIPLQSASTLEPRRTFAVVSSSDRVLVLLDGVCIASEEHPAAARAILLQSMAFPGEPAAILHAGGCGGVLLAGQTHSGKSTLCAALMSRGLAYHCDDSAVLDRDFRVAPMPFPLMLREGSWPLLGGRLSALDAAPIHQRFGTRVRFVTPTHSPGPSPVTALVFVKHDAAAQTELTALSVFATLLALQRSGFWVHHTRDGIQSFLTWLTQIRRYSLVYPHLSAAEQIIEELASRSPQST